MFKTQSPNHGDAHAQCLWKTRLLWKIRYRKKGRKTRAKNTKINSFRGIGCHKQQAWSNLIHRCLCCSSTATLCGKIYGNSASMCTRWRYLSVYWDTSVYITSNSFLVRLSECSIDSAQQQVGWRQQHCVRVCLRARARVRACMGYGQVCLQHERIHFCVNLHSHVCVCASAGMCVAMSAWGGVCVRVPSGAEVKTNHWMSALYWQMS